MSTICPNRLYPAVEEKQTFIVFYKVGDVEVSLGPFLATTTYHAIELAFGQWSSKYATRANYLAK